MSIYRFRNSFESSKIALRNLFQSSNIAPSQKPKRGDLHSWSEMRADGAVAKLVKRGENVREGMKRREPERVERT